MVKAPEIIPTEEIASHTSQLKTKSKMKEYAKMQGMSSEIHNHEGRTNRQELTILPAGKGGAIGIMAIKDYVGEIEILLDIPSYKSLSRNPTTSFEENTKEEI